MRAAVLFVILAISATVLSGAQCVVACVSPTPPPCHHSPEKGVKICDSTFVFGERQQVTVVETPASGAATNVHITGQPVPERAVLDTSRDPRRHPPGDSGTLILRI
jgi:hypothetical protein